LQIIDITLCLNTDQVHYMLVSTIVATLFGNGSNSTIEQSYLVVLDGDATQEQGMYQKIK